MHIHIGVILHETPILTVYKPVFRQRPMQSKSPIQSACLLLKTDLCQQSQYPHLFHCLEPIYEPTSTHLPTSPCVLVVFECKAFKIQVHLELNPNMSGQLRFKGKGTGCKPLRCHFGSCPPLVQLEARGQIFAILSRDKILSLLKVTLLTLSFAKAGEVFQGSSLEIPIFLF